MIKELSNKKAFISDGKNSANASSSIPYGKSVHKNIQNELNIKIPSYLNEKNSERINLNKSNEISNVNTLERRTPINSIGNQSKSTAAKEKGKFEKNFIHTNEGFDYYNIDNEKTMDTTNLTKHTALKDKNYSNIKSNNFTQNYLYNTTTNNYNESPNTKFEKSECLDHSVSNYYTINNISHVNGKKYNINNNSANKNSIIKNNVEKKFSTNFSNTPTNKNKTDKSINFHNDRLNNSAGGFHRIHNQRTPKKLNESYGKNLAKASSNGNLKRSYEVGFNKKAAEMKSTLRSKSTKSVISKNTSNNNKSSTYNNISKALNRSTTDINDSKNFQDNGK